MTDSSGKGYEKLTQRVFEALHAQQNVRNIRVEHDITLHGIVSAHQVDVYWEFESGGITYRTVVECKDWKQPVDQGTLFTLHTVLTDIQGQPRGVVVARNGFQEGARHFAEAHGIVLYELRAPKDEDWDGFITGVNITGQLLAPKLHEVQFPADQEWLAKEWERLGIPANETITLSGVAGEIQIEREDGSTLTTVGDVIEDHLLPTEIGPPEWREYVFLEPAYVVTNRSDLPRIRLRAARVRIELAMALKQEFQVRLDAFVALILKEVTKGTWTPLDAEGRPLEPGQPRPARLIESDNEAGDSTRRK
jgi:hypothetical protein